MDKREFYVTFHGHFYQPPRENPWIEVIEKQPSAYPFHNWNERIAHECYIPNAIARERNGTGKIIDNVNNYAYINFNFGPTLLSWYQKYFSREYTWLLDGDNLSKQYNNGHGNAIAQIYNHIIVPLANKRDRITQAVWGIEDFRYRFGRLPESIWLPETACNYATLEVLISLGMKYVILSPHQAERIRNFDKKQWIDVSRGNIDTRRAYRFFLKTENGESIENKFIDIFFYHSGLSRAIAFEDRFIDAKAFAYRIDSCFDHRLKIPQLINVATDGESYGHHKAFAEMTLAHLLKYELPRLGINVINYTRFLEISPPVWEVIIKDGREGEGTSWSCIHGLGRWKEDCGCTTYSQPGWNQKWRGPLRHALDELRRKLDEVFEQEGAKYLKDAWTAREEYVNVILDRNESTISNFLAKNARGEYDENTRTTILKLMEMQRHAMLMYTSCAWFFAEISGIETVQNLKYAARAIQLAKEITGNDFEQEFLNNLKEAKSNLPEYGDGWGVYNKLVRPSIVYREQVVSHYAICLLFGLEYEKLYHYTIEKLDLTRRETPGVQLILGQARLTSGITLEKYEATFLVIYLPAYRVFSLVGDYVDQARYEELKQRTFQISEEQLLSGEIHPIDKEYFSKNIYTLRDLFVDDREKIFAFIFKDKMEKLKSVYTDLLNEYLPIMEGFKELGMTVSYDLKGEIEMAMTRRLTLLSDALKEEYTDTRFYEIKNLLEKSRSWNLTLNLSLFEENLESIILKETDNVLEPIGEHDLGRLEKFINLMLPLNLWTWRNKIENRLFYFLQYKIVNTVEEGLDELDETKIFWLKHLLTIIGRLDFSTEYLYKKIENHKSRGEEILHT